MPAPNKRTPPISAVPPARRGQHRRTLPPWPSPRREHGGEAVFREGNRIAETTPARQGSTGKAGSCARSPVLGHPGCVTPSTGAETRRQTPPGTLMDKRPQKGREKNNKLIVIAPKVSIYQGRIILPVLIAALDLNRRNVVLRV